MTIAHTVPKTNTGLMLLAVLVAFVAMLVTGILVAGIAQLPTTPSYQEPFYGSLELTSHAATGHANQKWNTETIVDYFDAHKCIPRIYTCSAYDIEIHTCKIDDHKSIALIIGMTTRKIVTGFAAPHNYWDSRCP